MSDVTLRRADLARFKDPESIALMRAVKHALDPDNVHTPGIFVQRVVRLAAARKAA